MSVNINTGEIRLTKVPESYWIASTSDTDYPAPEYDISTDVAIVGGGMVGITLAYLLKKEGLKVAVIEADRIAKGTTGHTTAKITSQHSLIYNKLENAFGEEKARQYAEANEKAIEIIENIIKENNINCDFCRRPAYVYTQMDEYIKKIEDEVKTSSGLGIKAHYFETLPLPFTIKAAMRFDNQAQFHPRKYLLQLAAKIPGENCHIFEQTRVIDIEEGPTCTVIAENGCKISAKRVVIATHYPFYDRHGLYFTRLYPERSYILGTKIKEKFPDGMFITAEDPGRSLRSQPFGEGEIVLIGGEHHKTGHGENTFKHYENLKNFAQQTYTVQAMLYRWSAQDYTSMDEIPYTGHLTSNRTNIYVATGFKKWGMTNSTASAVIIRDLIVKGMSPWAPVYDPSRFTPGTSAKSFIMENADVAKNFIAGKLFTAPDDVEIKQGEGKIAEIGGIKAGVYRDEKGELHFVDTTCTHLGCELKWNAAEMSWDCPCHGSRFTFKGDIIEGPALKPIKPEIVE